MPSDKKTPEIDILREVLLKDTHEEVVSVDKSSQHTPPPQKNKRKAP